jgi:hypothetical protein
MEPLADCIKILRPLVAASDQGSIVLAERAIDAYLKVFQTPQSKTGAIVLFQQEVAKSWPNPSRAQADFIGVVLAYVDGQMRELREQS